MGLIRGENISMFINGELISCWRSSQLDITADTIGKSTIGSGNWKESEGVALGWTVSGEGQIYNDVSFSIHDAYDLMVTLEPVFLVFEVDDKDAEGNVLNSMYYYGTAIITAINETGSVNNIGSFNISFQGTGELLKDDTDIIYGNYPEGFEINTVNADTPEPGQTTLTLVWDESAPVAESYTVKVVDTTTDTFEEFPGLLELDGFNAVVDSTHEYELQIKSVYFGGMAESEYSPTIEWP